MERMEGNNEVRQAGYAMLHPYNAYHVKNSTNVTAGNFQINIGKAINRTQNVEGSPQNAIRHTLWQAITTKDIGKEQTTRVANAHEVTTNVDLKQRHFSNLLDADRTVDLLNNEIGRGIGERNKDASNQTMAKEVIEEYYKNGLWTVKGDAKNGFTIQKTKLTKAQYDAAIAETNKKEKTD